VLINHFLFVLQLPVFPLLFTVFHAISSF
jgi:hypothetical protein